MKITVVKIAVFAGLLIAALVSFFTVLHKVNRSKKDKGRKTVG